MKMQYYLSRDVIKLGYRIIDQVKHKPACAAKADG